RRGGLPPLVFNLNCFDCDSSGFKGGFSSYNRNKSTFQKYFYHGCSTIITLETRRSLPSEGELTRLPLMAMAEEPPPSKLMASTAPRLSMVAPNSLSVNPTERVGRRP